MSAESAPPLECRVAVARAGTAAYPSLPPFDPSTTWPEYPWKGASLSEANSAYDGVRKALELLGLDRAGSGTEAWNPLGEIVRPGDLVLLKPNLVRESREGRPGEWEQILTSASVVRAALDYVVIALSGRGRIVIADSPQTDSDFELIAERTGLRRMTEEIARRCCRELSIELIDLRSERWVVRNGICVGSEKLPGDPEGALKVDLGGRSHFADSRGTARFYGAAYDTEETNSHHSNWRHAYEVCGTALAADVIISIPKLKTHKKCGMTGCLKGLVGLAGNKNLLPHYRMGSPSEGGDQFPDDRRAGRLESRMVASAKRLMLGGGRGARLVMRLLKPLGYGLFGSTRRVIRSGNWSGNDTIWRTVLDLAAILSYCDSSGFILDRPARRFFNIVDGIVGGDGNGPLDADPVRSGLIIAGASPLAVDAVSAATIGMEPMDLGIVRNGFSSPWGLAPCPPGDLIVTGPAGETRGGLSEVPALSTFRPHFAWSGLQAGRKRK